MEIRGRIADYSLDLTQKLREKELNESVGKRDWILRNSYFARERAYYTTL